MGAYDFRQFENEPDAEKAFRQGIERAQYDHGHSGYTGTLAEKDSYVVFSELPPMEISAAMDRADEYITEDDERINDKWGPAGAIRVIGGTDHSYNPETRQYDSPCDGWLFFGWASS